MEFFCVKLAIEDIIEQSDDETDSVAVDPHKWLYAPLEAGCALVRDPDALRNAFSYHPPYYSFDVEATNYYDLGPQNSRGFRALKIWLAFQQAGAAACRQMIAEDIALARRLYELGSRTPGIGGAHAQPEHHDTALRAVGIGVPVWAPSRRSRT